MGDLTTEMYRAMEMYRGVVVWERPDGSQFEKHSPPRLSKGAANGDVTRELRYPGANKQASRRVEKSRLSWETIELDGWSV